MKLGRLSTFTRVVLVAGAVGLLGWWHKNNPAKKSAAEAQPTERQGKATVEKPDKKPAATTHPSEKKDKAGRLANEYAWLLSARAASKSGERDDWDRLIEMAYKIDLADIPFLLEQAALEQDDDNRRGFMGLLFDVRLVREDPKLALTLVDKYSDPVERAGMKSRIYASLLLKDSRLALEEIAKLPQGDLADEAYRNVFSQWATYLRDTPPQWAGVEPPRPPDPATAGDPFAPGPRQDDSPLTADKAIATAVALPAGSERDQALCGIVDGLAYLTENPKTAQALLDWAGSLPAADYLAMEEAVIQVAEGQPELAEKYLNKLTSEAVRKKAVEVIARTRAARDN